MVRLQLHPLHHTGNKIQKDERKRQQEQQLHIFHAYRIHHHVHTAPGARKAKDQTCQNTYHKRRDHQNRTIQF